jgi:hypothetical protein
MGRGCDSINWQKVAEWRERINRAGAGSLLDHATEARLFREVIEGRSPRDLKSAIRALPHGADGSTAFRDVSVSMLVRGLGPAIEIPLVRREVPAGPGRADFELPLRRGASCKFPVLSEWARDYRLTSIVGEAKNYSAPCGLESVRQALDYLNTLSFGRVAIIVARNGFDASAKSRIGDAVRKENTLLLPLCADDLLAIADLAGLRAEARCRETLAYLGRRETVVRQEW